MADDRTYIRVHDGLYEHPKVVSLSDAGFRLLVESWCYCSRNLTDGRITDAAWKRLGTPKARRELIAAGLAEQGDGLVVMHDYLEHQRSAAEVAEHKAKKRKAGALGNHTKWHTERGIVDPSCSYCGSHKESHVRSQVRSQTGRTAVAETETETKVSGYVGGEGHQGRPQAVDTPPLYAGRCSRHGNVAEPGPCGDCADARKAAQQRPTGQDYRLRVVPDLCGDCDDRWIDTPAGAVHCPRCHPAEVPA